MTPEEKRAVVGLLGYRILVEPSQRINGGTYVAVGERDKEDEELAGYGSVLYKHYGPDVCDPVVQFLKALDLSKLGAT